MRKATVLLLVLAFATSFFGPPPGMGKKMMGPPKMFDDEVGKALENMVKKSAENLKEGGWLKYLCESADGKQFYWTKKYLGVDEKTPSKYLSDAEGLVYGWFEEVYVELENSKPLKGHKMVLKKLELVPELSDPEKLKEDPPITLLVIQQFGASDPLIVYEYKPEEKKEKPEVSEEPKSSEEKPEIEKPENVPETESKEAVFELKGKKYEAVHVKLYHTGKGKKKLFAEVVLPAEGFLRVSVEPYTFFSVKDYDDKGKVRMTAKLVDFGEGAKSEIVGKPRKLEFNFPFGGMGGFGGG